ncbi:DUF58 domain-containing protein [Planctomonas deserti]|uniref:DUF58 domain-containing protein n=1 Tax=Planctomonas deserti TaxID=2144185 RepID=UPI001F0B7C3D|nr:DUF58 domain-containing protein [Planctomonas deserti]
MRGSTSGSGGRARFESEHSTGMSALSNRRTRIVGGHTGVIADLAISLVRFTAAARRLVARALRTVGSVVTPLGWTIAAFVLLGFTAGYALGWLEFIAVAWAGLVLFVVALFSLLRNTPLDIRIAMPHTRVVVGDRAPGQVIVRNPTSRRLLGTTVEVPVARGLAEFPVPSLRAGRTYEEVFVVPTTARGVLEVGPVRTVKGDPIGLLRRESGAAEALRLFVHPRTIPVPSMSTGFVRDLEGNPTRDLSASDVAFHAVREYSPGDERRHIHWRSSAKTGTVMVRQFEETRRSHIMIALSLASSDYATDEEFELAVSVAGSLGVRAISDARNVSIVASERTPEFAKRKTYALRRLSTITRTRLLDDLSVVQRADNALALVDLARVAGESVSGMSVAFLVCGTGASSTELRAASIKFPLGVEVVAVVCDPGATPGLRRVAGLSVLTVGYLDDLAKSLTRSAAA